MVKAKGGPIAADGLYGQWQSPPYPPATISPTNTITLSESERNNPFPIFPRLNCPLLPSSFPPFVSPPPFDVVQLYQGNSLERVGKLRNVSRLLIYLSLSLFSLPVTIKSKVFDTKNKKKKGYIPSWNTSIAFYGYFCCSILSPSNCCTLDRTTRIERYAVKMRLEGLFVIMGRESNARAFALSSLPSRRLVGISIVGGTCRIRELRPMQRIPEYNQPRRGVISVYPVIIVQRESWSN